MKKLFKFFGVPDIVIWCTSVAAILISFFVFKSRDYASLAGSLIGVTSLIFVANGNPIGQALVIVFSVFYGIVSYSFSYYGEMITYLGMSAPIAVWALISWLKNPSSSGRSEVKVNSISRREWLLFLLGTTAVTVAFYFILRALDTANLIISTVSVFTSFSAAYLTARRSRFYAAFYAVNDVVLIVMWVLASVKDAAYVPIVVCFVAFLALDGYGFVNWSKMKRRQAENAEERSTEAFDNGAR